MIGHEFSQKHSNIQNRLMFECMTYFNSDRMSTNIHYILESDESHIIINVNRHHMTKNRKWAMWPVMWPSHSSQLLIWHVFICYYISLIWLIVHSHYPRTRNKYKNLTWWQIMWRQYSLALCRGDPVWTNVPTRNAALLWLHAHHVGSHPLRRNLPSAHTSASLTPETENIITDRKKKNPYENQVRVS